MHRRSFLAALAAVSVAPFAFLRSPVAIIRQRKLIARVRITEEALQESLGGREAFEAWYARRQALLDPRAFNAQRDYWSGLPLIGPR